MEFLRRTPLYDRHVALNAKMAPFAGFEMPIEYETGLIKEHMAVRTAAGLFDVSHMGDLIVRGRRALDVLQVISANDASELEPGQVQYSYMPFPDGDVCGVVDDFLVFRLQDRLGGFLIVPNASNYEEVRDKILQYASLTGVKLQPYGTEPSTYDTNLEDASSIIGQLALQGPKALEIAQKLTDTPITHLAPNHHVTLKFAGHDGVILSTTGYTGAGGCEIYAYSEDLPSIWDALLEVGSGMGLIPCGLGARDTLRLEAGFCLYGHELTKSLSPFSAGLGWCTKLNGKKEWMKGRAALETMKREGPSYMKLVCFVMDKKGPSPRPGYLIRPVDADSKFSGGIVTSGSPSPCLNSLGIGMGYFPRELSKVGTPIDIEFPSRRPGDAPRRVRATIVKSALSIWEAQQKA